MYEHHLVKFVNKLLLCFNLNKLAFKCSIFMNDTESSLGDSTEHSQPDNENIDQRFERLSTLAEKRRNKPCRLLRIAKAIGLKTDHLRIPDVDDKPLTTID
jgi:hypothetical protein